MRRCVLAIILSITTILTLSCNCSTSTPTNTSTNTSTSTSTTISGATISGHIYYNGKIITDYTEAEAVVRLINVDSWESVPVEYSYDKDKCYYTIKGVPPGEYITYTCIESGYPFNVESAGDFSDVLSGLNPHIIVSSATEVIQCDLSVIYHLHLTSPIDNQEITRSVNDKPEKLNQSINNSQFIFRWEPVPDATSYNVRIILKDDSTNQSITVVGEIIYTNQYLVNLDVTLENQYYMFLVYGYNNNNELIGLFRYYYTDGNGGWYNFAVISE